MREHWVWSVDPANWKTVTEKNVWATASKTTTEKVRKGDAIMFYLVGRGIFCGACEVASDWYESQKLLWPDEIAEQKKKYKNECRVKMVRKGEASFSELIPKLSFVTNRTYAGAYLRGTRGGPANFSKPIPLDDYTTIMSAL